MEVRSDIGTKPNCFDDCAGLFALRREALDFMDVRIDPPSSLHRFDAAKLAAKARDEELVLAFVNSELAGCLFAAPREDSFYLGQIAVRRGLQGRGLARRMIALSEAGARSPTLKHTEFNPHTERTEKHLAN